MSTTLVEGAFTEVTEISPSLAARWLESTNRGNRRLDDHRARTYATIMQRGGWHTTHQGIAFFEDGRLADGQHRLAAVVLSGVSVRMNVTYGLAVTAAVAIDEGKTRSVTDVMVFRGSEVSGKFVPTARALYEQYEYSRGRPAINRTLDRERLIQFAEAARPAIEFALASSHGKRGLSHSAVRAAIAAAWYTADIPRLSQFKEQLESGLIEDNRDTAVLRLRDWLQTTNTRNGNARTEIWRRSCTALAAYLERRPLAKLYAREGASFPLPDLI